MFLISIFLIKCIAKKTGGSWMSIKFCIRQGNCFLRFQIQTSIEFIKENIYIFIFIYFLYDNIK